ncbi:MAG: DUF1284 domain-containing protein [Oscillospiraceae bacterium]|nr:DUF1284 domain-containing protein [Oscillospiraceae bacterium]
MRLRAHHLLCLPHFIGRGYDGAFTANMARQKRRLAEEGSFTLCEGADELCAACPRRSGGGCADGEKPLRYDRLVCEALGLEPGRRYEAAAVEARVRSEILEPGRLAELCGDCEWAALCAALDRQA